MSKAEKTTQHLPEVNQDSFLQMNDWGQGVFEQLKDGVEVKPGNGDKEALEVALERFSGDIAYSGLVVAYQRFQRDSALDKGSKATKFDVLIHLYDYTKELFTDTDSRRQVQAVIVNLCGGPEWYKFLYGDGAENYSVAHIVHAVVENWARTRSKEARIDGLNELAGKKAGIVQTAIDQLPKEPEWGSDQKTTAERFYNEKLTDEERVKVDDFVKTLLGFEIEEGEMVAIFGHLPGLKRDWDIAARKTDSDWLVEQILIPGTNKPVVVEKLKSILSMKETPKKDRANRIIENAVFFAELADTLRWRMEAIKEKQTVEREIFSQVDNLELTLVSQNSAGYSAEVGELITRMKQLGINLDDKKELSIQANDAFPEVGEVKISLNPDLSVKQCSFIHNGSKEDTAKKLDAVQTIVGKKLKNDFMLINDEKGIVLKDFDGSDVARVLAGKDGLIEISPIGNVSLISGMDLLTIVGQAFNDVLNQKKSFPGLHLGIKETEVAEVEEPAVPEKQPEPEAAEETSVVTTELPEEIKAEEPLILVESETVTPAAEDEKPGWLKSMESKIQQPAGKLKETTDEKKNGRGAW